jgi:hypothetical protein
MGEPLSPGEAERQLYYGHLAIAKVIRSKVDLSELKEEFEVAGENYAFVANHIWTPLRVVIRFIAPVVLVAALLAIWVAMIAATPWMGKLRNWWQHRGDQQAPQPPQSAPAGDTVTVVESGDGEPPQQAPSLPRRPAVIRRFG